MTKMDESKRKLLECSGKNPHAYEEQHVRGRNSIGL